MKDTLTRATERTKSILAQLEGTGFDMDDPWGTDHNLPDNLEIESGATRFVIWDTNYNDFVIKFSDEERYEAYSAKEAEVYHKAEEKGVEKYFGWIHFICNYQNHAVYAMEYLDCDEETISNKSYEYNWKEFCSEENIDDDEDTRNSSYRYEFDEAYMDCNNGDYGVLNYLFSEITNEDMIKLDHLIYDEDVNDLHEGNFGFRGNQLVICDYAGYGWV